jgi:hypothetical protein
VAARGVVLKLITSLQVCGIDSQVVKDAEALPVKDDEDAVRVASAMAAGLDAIIPCNVNDYKNSPLPVYSPTDFLARL